MQMPRGRDDQIGRWPDEVDVQLIHEYTNIRESLPSEGRDSRELVECTIVFSKFSTTPGDIEIS